MVDKDVLRKVYLEKRLTLSSTELKRRNELLVHQLFDFIDFRSINWLHSFLSIVEKKEVDTASVIEKARDINPKLNVVTSRTRPKGLLEHYVLDDNATIEKNAWGIPEPVRGTLADIHLLDVVLVPLISFDKEGQRIGYGKGYYDRFLKKIPEAKKIGVSLGPPLDKILYSNKFDVVLDACVTPFKVYQF